MQDEVGHVFEQVLEDAGVYKLDEAGRAGFERFLSYVSDQHKKAVASAGGEAFPL